MKSSMAGNGCGYESDPRVGFAQFLKEARTHAYEGDLDSATEEAGKKQFDGAKKNKKSLRSSLFSWLKVAKKSKPNMEPSNNSYNISKRTRGYVSGPINGSGGGSIGRWPGRPNSGPLLGLFNSTKRMEDEIPYMSLDGLSNPHGVQPYGPIYMVT